jgi:hypothetical protein
MIRLPWLPSLLVLAPLLILGGCQQPPKAGSGPGALDVTVSGFAGSGACRFVINRGPQGVTMDSKTGEIRLNGYAGPITWTTDLDPTLAATWPAAADAIWLQAPAAPRARTFQAGFSAAGADPTVALGVLTVQIADLSKAPATTWRYRLNLSAAGADHGCASTIVTR